MSTRIDRRFDELKSQGVVYWPDDPWMDRFVEVHLKTWYRNGGEPRMGRHLVQRLGEIQCLLGAEPKQSIGVPL